MSTPPSDSGPSPAAKPASDPEPEPAKLPPLTAEQFRVYNRLAVQMDYFHEHFRHIWKTLYSACESGRRPAGMTLKQFIDEGLNLVRYLEAHHRIEETHLFPILARKMPQFGTAIPSGKKKKKADCELLKQHEKIHEGMDLLEDYLRACKNKEVEFELGVLKEKMDSWGEVLMKHLDEEVETLGAENMRKYYTLEEVRAIPI
ncbi:hypothetical protein OQA88_9257 [Cercophora sp. LCS_1]